jgi:glucokinase
MNDADYNDWLLADIDGETVSFGLAKPTKSPAIERVRTYKTADFPTATDCFMCYASEEAIDLKGLRAGISVSGVVKQDSVRIQRCRWSISITGLTYLLGSRPLIVNDSVSKSWINLDRVSMRAEMIGGEGAPDFSKPGRWTTINFHNGLGASIVNRLDADTIFVTESECGHIAFAPLDQLERDVSGYLAKASGRVTYEQMLFIGYSDPVWRDLGITISDREHERMKAAVLGAFAGDMTLAFAGWSGLFLHGVASQILTKRENVEIFNKRFEEKANFRSNVRTVPRFLAPFHPHNLAGVAQMLAAQNKIF